MSRRLLTGQVFGMLALACGAESARIREDSELARLGTRRLTSIDLGQVVEQRFKVRLTERELAFCETAGTLVDVIENRLERLGGAL